MGNRLTTLLVAGIGAMTMYYFDPARGRYRRALVRDQLVHGGHEARRGVGVVRRDLRNRGTGTLARMLSLLDDRQPDDAVLAERVRACLGRVVTHPSSIEVESRDGVVTLSGPVLRDEVPLLLDCVLGVRGVRDLRNELQVHSEPGNVPGLQGRPRQRPGQRSAFMQENWSPTARAAGGAAGALAAVFGLNRHGASGTLVGAAGLVLLARALTNLDLQRLFGLGVPRHAVDVQKSLRIDAPPEKVFALWDNPENFPSFMTHVHRVRRLQDDRGGRSVWRWTVQGPTGTEFEFDAVITAREENRLIAWSTEPGALVQHAGRVRFQPNADGSTTVDVKMVYNPVAGAVGHAIAWLFGVDPKHQLDDDLMRTKTFLETGRTPRDAASHAPPGGGNGAEARPGGNGAEEPPAPGQPPGQAG